MKEPIFGAPKRHPIRDPFGRPLDEYCLADNKAISCSGDDGTMEPYVKHVADAFGYEAEHWWLQPEIGLTIDCKHVRLDILVADAEGNLLDVEGQKSGEGTLVDRLTAYSSYLIGQQLSSGKGYGELKKTVVAFVCKDDPLDEATAVDEMAMVHLHNGQEVGAKFRWIVLSRKYLKGAPKGKMEWLLHDFFETDVGKMHSPEMAKRLKYLRTEEGVRMMFETREQEIARNRAEAEAKKTEEDVQGMHNEGFPIETVAKIARIGISDVKAIADRHGVKLP